MSKVLYVEDEADLRDYLVEELLDEGYEVLEAENGQQGLEMASTDIPDLIISDITMPVMNGMDMLEKIKENASLTEIPVILLSALNDEEFHDKANKLGVEVYFVKPADMRMLMYTVNGILS